MKLFFDTEFTGLHKDTTLISIGIISEDNRCFYGTFTDYDESQVDDWISENVINNLSLSKKLKRLFDVTEVTGTKEEIKESFLEWLTTFDDEYFELVSDVCHYDMVLFIDMFGTAFDLPEFISPAIYDINNDLSSWMNISLADAFNLNREDFLKEIVENSDDDIYYELMPILKIGETDKHNSLYDAIIIKYLYELAIPYIERTTFREEGLI